MNVPKREGEQVTNSVFDFSSQFEHNRHALLNELVRGIEEALVPFQVALDGFLAKLSEDVLPSNWREQWEAFVIEQQTQGFTVHPTSVTEMETWIEFWAKEFDLLPLLPEQEVTGSLALADEPTAAEPAQGQDPQLGAAAGQLLPKPTPQRSTTITSKRTRKDLSGPRGNQSNFAREAEEMVSEATGIPRNTPGPKQQTIRGSGPGGMRLPDLVVRGPRGSVRLRGTVVEVKASTGDKFGALSERSREQIRDAVAYVEKLRKKASLVKNPTWRSVLLNAHVEVFSDLPQPKSGEFAKLIARNRIKWNTIPRSVTMKRLVTAAPKSIGKPGIGTARNLALGIVTALVESKVANETYTENAELLNDLLSRIERDGKANDADWKEIGAKIDAIANMEQSAAGYAFEIISYGQGSLIEQKELAMAVLADELAERFGYRRVRTWIEWIRGGWGRFEKNR